jgi:molybdopterin converting factor small subunit
LPATVTVRYFAAARAAAGVAEEQLTVRRPEDRELTVAMVLAEASERHGAGLRRVLPRCSYLLDETAVHGADTVVRHGQVIDVLPPFAGGANSELGRAPSPGRPPCYAVSSAPPR